MSDISHEYCGDCKAAIPSGKFDVELNAIVFKRIPCPECGSFNRAKINLDTYA